MAQKIVPNLWFDDTAEEAVTFYTSIFGNSRILNTSHYGKLGAKVSGRPEGSVLTVDFELEGSRFVALNGGPVFRFTPAISFFVTCGATQEVERLYAALSPKGSVLMPLDKYPFSEKYAWINDRYGLSWQLFLGPGKQGITPFIMFFGKNYAKAAEAVSFYTSTFEHSRVENIVPYDKNEGQNPKAIKQGAFILDDNRFILMDSGVDHQFAITPAISFMVNCRDQQEIDRLWERLSAVPEAEQCGWLQDRYGVSWQIGPAFLGDLVQDENPTGYERMMEVLIPMKKLDYAALLSAYGKK
jgi:predicted 3-demethylubiquinone-9 3-methyltransferase (glyoxalase superfamily)